MKYAKMLGLLAMAAAALMAFAGSASATTSLTDASGAVLGVGTHIHAESVGHVVLHAALTVECESTVTGDIDDIVNGTPTGAIDVLSFSNCTNERTVTVISKGSLEIHTEGASSNGNGTLTSDGAEVTVLAHLPFSVTTHCIFATSNTDVGKLTGSVNTGGTPTLDIESAAIPVVSTDFGCGSSATWTGDYKVTTPDYMDVD